MSRRERRTIVRHGRVRDVPRSGWLRVVRGALTVLVVCAVAAASVVSIAAWRLSTEVASRSVDISNGAGSGDVTSVAAPSIAAMNGAFNVLLVGADNSPGRSRSGPRATRPSTTSTSSSTSRPTTAAATVVSLPRDLVIAHPSATDPTTQRDLLGDGGPAAQHRVRAAAASAASSRRSRASPALNIPYAALFSFEGTVEDGRRRRRGAGLRDQGDRRPRLRPQAEGRPLGRSRAAPRSPTCAAATASATAATSPASRSQQAYMSSLLRTMTSRGTFTDPDELYGLAQRRRAQRAALAVARRATTRSSRWRSR